MTQPDPNAAAAAEQQLQVRAQTVPGPDGQPWVALVISSGLVGFQAAVTPDGADALAEAVSHCLRTEAATARRQRSGLILPSEIQGQNGGRPS